MQEQTEAFGFPFSLEGRAQSGQLLQASAIHILTSDIANKLSIDPPSQRRELSILRSQTPGNDNKTMNNDAKFSSEVTQPSSPPLKLGISSVRNPGTVSPPAKAPPTRSHTIRHGSRNLGCPRNRTDPGTCELYTSASAEPQANPVTVNAVQATCQPAPDLPGPSRCEVLYGSNRTDSGNHELGKITGKTSCEAQAAPGTKPTTAGPEISTGLLNTAVKTTSSYPSPTSPVGSGHQLQATTNGQATGTSNQHSTICVGSSTASSRTHNESAVCTNGTNNTAAYAPNLDPHALITHSSLVASIWPSTTPLANEQFPEFCDLYSTIKSFNLPNAVGAKITLRSGLHPCRPRRKSVHTWA